MAGDGIMGSSLADEIAFRVEIGIMEGSYPPGSRLRQDELCDRFGVSRTPVREALRKLQARNLVIVAPNRGATVRIPTRRELLEVYAIRSELEGYSAELAAARVSDAHIEELELAQSRLVGLVSKLEEVPGSRPEPSLDVQLNNANDAFHGVIHRASGNRRLYELVVELGVAVPKDYVWRAIASSDDMRLLNVEEHGRIRAALLSGDAGAARTHMRDHILHARSLLLTYLDQHGFWT